jgi:hypothetical protein
MVKSVRLSKNQNHLDKKSALMQVKLQSIGSLDKLKPESRLAQVSP